MLATLSLRFLLKLRVLELSEVACVLEDLDESIFVESLVSGLANFANSIDRSLKETFLGDVCRIDVDKNGLLVVFGGNDTLLDGRVLDSDRLTQLNLVDHNGLVAAEEVERDFVFAVTLHRNVKSGQDSKFVLKHLGGDGVLHNVDIGGTLLNLLVEKSKNALRLEELFDEAHVAANLQVLVLLDGEAEHDWGCLLEVLPELGILALGEQVSQDVGVGGGGVLGSRGGLSEAVDDLEGHSDALLEFVHLGAGGSCFLLHGF